MRIIAGALAAKRPHFLHRRTETIVETARSSGRPVVAHASTAEGMRRAVLAGVETIDHGDDGTPEIFKLMAERRSRCARHSPPVMRPRSTPDGRRGPRRSRPA